MDPSGSKWILALVSYDSKRDMCSRVQLIFKNHPDLYVPINPIFFPKLDVMTLDLIQCTMYRTHFPFVKLRHGSGKDRQGMATKAKGLKA